MALIDSVHKPSFLIPINNKARKNLMDAKFRWPSNWLDGAVSFREALGQTKVLQIPGWQIHPAGGDCKPPGGNNP